MENQKGIIFEIQHTAVYDGPGIRTVIYLKGCPLCCAWCHNPEGIEKACETWKDGKALGYEMTVGSIMEELICDKPFYGEKGGLTLSGGEPFFQPDFACSILKEAHDNNINTCVETSGFCFENTIRRAVPVTDLFLFDIKETADTNHKKFTGVSNDLILKNLYLLNQLGANIILRCPIIFDVNMRNAHFEKIAEYAENLTAVKAIELEPYHPIGLSKYARLGKTPRYDNSEFLQSDDLAQYAKKMRQITKKAVRLSTGESI